MVLMSFSEPAHIQLLKNGKKKRTTRPARKIPVKVGDTLHCYFKSRMKKGTCKNCIDLECKRSEKYTYRHDCYGSRASCHDWTNFFGTAKSVHVRRTKIINLTSVQREGWAITDGFANFKEADEWFTRVHGDEWMWKDFDIIDFEPDWLIGDPND